MEAPPTKDPPPPPPPMDMAVKTPPPSSSSDNTTKTTEEVLKETIEKVAAEVAQKTKTNLEMIRNGENVEFKVIYNKKKYDLSFGLDNTVGELKNHLQQTIISIPPAMMKVMIKGLAKDEMTLRQIGVTNGSKVMVVGSSLGDVLAVSKQPPDATKTSGTVEHEKDKDKDGEKERLCRQKMHKKILDKGKPEDAMVGIKGVKEPLPLVPISGMLNKQGGKVRLTFKTEMDQLWIGTKERTQKLPMNSIKAVISEPIEEHDEYHILALQLGPTEASRYWLYWVPAQYVDAIKDSILGKWQYY